MTKKLIGSDIGSYVFDPVAKTITINNLGFVLGLEQLLLITNTTDNIIIYNFADSSTGAIISNNTITLNYNTTSMSASDKLQIYIDVPQIDKIISELSDLGEQFTYDTNLSQVLGTQSLIDSGSVKTQSSFKDIKKSGRIGSLNEAIEIDCTGYNTGTFQLSGAWSGAVTFEGTIDGGNWISIPILNIAGTGSVSYGFAVTTSNNIYRTSTSGLIRIRARMSTYNSGTVQITLSCSYASLVALANVNTSGQMIVNEANISGSISPADLYTQEQIAGPTINKGLPSSYVMNNLSKFPQIFQRVRVQSAGDKKLPFAQTNITNELNIASPEIYRLLENIYMQMMIQTEILATAHSYTLPTDIEQYK